MAVVVAFVTLAIMISPAIAVNDDVAETMPGIELEQVPVTEPAEASGGEVCPDAEEPAADNVGGVNPAQEESNAAVEETTSLPYVTENEEYGAAEAGSPEDTTEESHFEETTAVPEAPPLPPPACPWLRRPARIRV